MHKSSDSSKRVRLPDSIKRKHVVAAAEAIDAGIEHAFADSTKYDAIINGKRYAPKAIIGLAAKYAESLDLRPEHFSGGVGSKCFRILKELEIEVVAKLGTESNRPPRSWLLVTIEESERIYHGNLGYSDEINSVYRYDNFVPNSTQLAVGDIAIVRGKTSVHGSGVVQSLKVESGTKLRQRCPDCNATHLKQRKRMTPRFRCQCGFEFDTPVEDETEATLYEANFGDSFTPLTADVDVQKLWAFAPRLNKQLSILELDTFKTQQFLRNQRVDILQSGELPVAATAGSEGRYQTVSVNRYERKNSLRQVCLDYHGYSCLVCGFNFGVEFGEAGEKVIEVHHLDPLSDGRGAREVDAIRDLCPLCPNCHTMAHKRNPPFTIDELIKMRRSQQTV